MLIDFSATNFRSISGRQTFSMQKVSRIAELPDHVIENKNTNLIRSAVIYGRNASGKSNLLSAMDCLSKLVSKENFHLKDVYHPFKLNLNSPNEPTLFEINFYAANHIRYFYEISFTDKEIIKENLFHYSGSKKARLFLRNQERLTTEIASLKDIFKIIYPYHSILSRLNLHKIEQLIPVYEFFSKHFLTRILLNEELDSYFEINKGGILDRVSMMPHHIENLGKMIRIADTGIDSIELKQLQYDDFSFPDETEEIVKEQIMQQIMQIKQVKIVLKHPIYINGNKVGLVDFDID